MKEIEISNLAAVVGGRAPIPERYNWATIGRSAAGGAIAGGLMGAGTFGLTGLGAPVGGGVGAALGALATGARELHCQTYGYAPFDPLRHGSGCASTM